MVGSDAVSIAFVLFCRIGGCLMLMPGFSNIRIPLNVRLFIAISITLALTPLLAGDIEKNLSGLAPMALTKIFISETLVGAMIGFLGRSFYGALETLGGVIAMSIGLSSALAGPIDESEPLPAITSLITLTATASIFFSDLHWEILRGIALSYTALPVAGIFDARFDLVQVTDCLTKSFFVSLRISSPFITFALITNFVIGLAGKLAPQIPLYFITVPAMIIGGMFLFYIICTPFMQIFNVAFSKWLGDG
ncbi:MAG TPA: flagellar biosynthetic protein FliR [Methylocella sp.]|jgi:flagellar biosynthetic protein FliR